MSPDIRRTTTFVRLVKCLVMWRMTMSKKPETPREMALYRGKLSCKLGRDALDGKGMGKNASDVNQIKAALFNVLHVLDDIIIAMGEEK